MVISADPSADLEAVRVRAAPFFVQRAGRWAAGSSIGSEGGDLVLPEESRAAEAMVRIVSNIWLFA